jgi:hypothetical protein
MDANGYRIDASELTVIVHSTKYGTQAETMELVAVTLERFTQSRENISSDFRQETVLLLLLLLLYACTKDNSLLLSPKHMC